MHSSKMVEDIVNVDNLGLLNIVQIMHEKLASQILKEDYESQKL